MRMNAQPPHMRLATHPEDDLADTTTVPSPVTLTVVEVLTADATRLRLDGAVDLPAADIKNIIGVTSIKEYDPMTDLMPEQAWTWTGEITDHLG